LNIVLVSRLYREVTFQKWGLYINLSRCNPLDVSTLSAPHRYVVARGDKAGALLMMCLSVGEVVGCYLHHPKLPAGAQTVKSKQIEVHLFEGEFEHQVCALGYIYRMELVALPIHDGALQFGTSNYQARSK